ncbi:MAG: hypothetical protein E7241_02365 [Lachnospiraceae bacterium]|nr:hypothetical protein [Lachnospiraceae bacterium]
MSNTDSKALSKKKMALYLPIVCGILAGLSFVIYVWSANSAPLFLNVVIYTIPLFCLIGTIAAIINRREINKHPALWAVGFMICALGLVFCIFFLMLLAILMT